MKKRIIPLFFLVLLLATVMIPTSAAISTKAISGKPTLKIEGTTAYCVGKYNSGNRNDAISITVTLMQGSKEIASWSASGKGSVTISKTCKVETKKTYKLVLSATVNNQSKYGTSETLTASQFKVSNKSADILARIFCGHYERPGVPKISERVANAKKWYNFL